MFGNGKKNKGRVRAKAGAADTLITRDTKITGDIQFKGVLYIDGHIVGNVKADELEMSLLTIGKHGVIEGQVEVPHVVILGKVNGDVHASEHVELESSAHIEGDVYYKLIEMAMGSEVNGKMVHRDDKPKLLNHQKEAAADKSVTDKSASESNQHAAKSSINDKTSDRNSGDKSSDKASDKTATGV
ncbi:bactofilin family protein [Pleionea mediterranea]|uniref:Polymer-forming protein n=1 Tax=Pleionea mediterranea TaxID=523701 RepID=A0A316FEC5_9GAMM|nr:polymer-forming cytoskeletal protein [Pleionea mediterranea]PWK45400.1 polymer-forming protein [Pleionea mediterranea]